jgi:hypothetical protein
MTPTPNVTTPPPPAAPPTPAVGGGGQPLVFVSCGQVTQAEKELGRKIVALVEGRPGVRAYFAQEVSSLQALSTNIFSNLKEASAVIAVMHHRGTVRGRPGDPERIRASVWIEQEIAIAAFLSHTRGSEIPIAAYHQKGMVREGVREQLILNAFEFETEDQILGDLRSKLATWNLKPLRPDEPRLDVNLGFDTKDTSAERHDYRLKATLTNTSNVRIPKVETSLEFPRPFVPGGISYAAERMDRATESHRIFRGEHKVDLLPGEQGVIYPFDYSVTDNLDWKYYPTWNSIQVKLRTFVNDREAGAATKLFSDLQKF